MYHEIMPSRHLLVPVVILALTVLEGRFRDACFCGARSNDGASERSISPPWEGGEKARNGMGMNTKLVQRGGEPR